jgi:subtilisin-like proprotein convertase family protein
MSKTEHKSMNGSMSNPLANGRKPASAGSRVSDFGLRISLGFRPSVFGFILFLAVSSNAALFTQTVNQQIPDGGGASQTLSTSINVSGVGSILSGINVILNIAGGFNGDLYATLRGPGGASAPFAVLLNRVGVTSGDPFGYGDSGFTITLSDSATHDVHFYNNNSPSFNGSGQLTGTWQADGRNIDPASDPSSFDTASRDHQLSQFNGYDPNGAWTLTFSDWSGGGDPSSLVSWSLDLTSVPEPTNVALILFGAAAGLTRLISWTRRMKNRR